MKKVKIDRNLVNVKFVKKSSRMSRTMKRRIHVLIFSIFVALIVTGIGIFGASQINGSSGKKGDKKKGESVLKESDTEQDTQDNEESDNSEEVPEETTQPETETTTEQSEENGQEGAVEIDPNKPMIALTFDDGPSSENTPRLLDVLKENNAHATFFVVGYNVDGNEEIVKRAMEEGNEIGSHTLNHSKLTSVDDATLEAEIGGMKAKIQGITGQETVIIRPPYGAVDEREMAYISDPVILWSIDTEDWKTRDVQSTIQNIQQNVFDGSIILMHDIHAETVDAAIQIIPWLKEQGYQLVTVSELGYYRRGGLHTGVKYGSLEPN